MIEELLKAYSDIPIALLSLVFGILILKKEAAAKSLAAGEEFSGDAEDFSCEADEISDGEDFCDADSDGNDEADGSASVWEAARADGARSRNAVKSNALLFIIIFLASVLGIIVHGFNLSADVHERLWMILYVLLFEGVRRTALLLESYAIRRSLHFSKAAYDRFVSKNGTPFTDRSFTKIESVFCVAAIILLVIDIPYDMFCLLAFSLFVIVKLIATVKQYEAMNQKLLLLCAACVAGGLFQGLSGIVPFGVTVGHVFIIAAEVILFLISTEEIK